MARFSTEYAETFTVPVATAIARDYFGDVDRIAANLEGIERVERLDRWTLRVVMAPLTRGPVTFRGEYQCRWDLPAEGVLTWEPAGPGNVSMRGEARFSATGPETTRIAFRQSVEAEIAVNRFLAPFAGPVVNREIERLTRRYLERARESLQASPR